jgi:hypothetical protein
MFQDDPFQGVEARRPPAPAQEAPSFFQDNFTLKGELYSQFSYSDDEPHEGDTFARNVYSRQSAGFEILKKFSTATSTVAAFDVQGRLVRRDHFVETVNDMEGEDREGRFFEVHNLYLDLYNVLDPLLDAGSRGAMLGRVNFRAGHFYLPMGLNLQTDTHGTLLQLSNDMNFGYERDWYAGFWGSLTEDLNYDAYYMVGSGAPLRFEGQNGLAGVRVSLADAYRVQYGLEAGIAAIYGRRLEDGDEIVGTSRAGLDARYTLAMPPGSWTAAAEATYGRDEDVRIVTQLYQLDFLSRRRSWGASVQYRRRWMEGPAEASLIGELAWYFRNDPANASLHWIRFNVERRHEREEGGRETVWTLQYYLYW